MKANDANSATESRAQLASFPDTAASAQDATRAGRRCRQTGRRVAGASGRGKLVWALYSHLRADRTAELAEAILRIRLPVERRVDTRIAVHVDEAIQLLERRPPGAELARAYGSMAAQVSLSGLPAAAHRSLRAAEWVLTALFTIEYVLRLVAVRRVGGRYPRAESRRRTTSRLRQRAGGSGGDSGHGRASLQSSSGTRGSRAGEGSGGAGC